MKTILVVDDDKLNLSAARKVLSGEYKVIPVVRGTQVLSYLENEECDMILLDISMPEMDGFELLRKIRTMENGKDIPVIFLTADNDTETETRCFKEGAIDFIVKPFVPAVMQSRIGRALELEELRRGLADKLEKKTREVSDIKSKSYQDALTGLWNRAYTENAVNEMISQGKKGALFMLDMDNFKAVNDNYGHIAGDETLKIFAGTLKKFAGEGDVLCRIGGDEFMIFVKDVTEKSELGSRAAEIISGFQKKFAEFAKGKTEYEGVVERIDEIIAKRMPVTRQLNYLYEALSGAIEFGSPYMIMYKIKTALKEKNDSLLTASKAQLEEVFNDIHNKDYDHEVDRAVAKAILPVLAQKLQPEQLPVFYQTIQSKYKGDYNAFVDDMYDNSILANRTNFDKFMKKPTVKAIEKDPATAYSRSKIEKLKAVSIEEKALSNGLELLHKAYIRGLGEMKLPVPSYPDANFTLRLTYGNVKAYSPRDAIHYNYYTTTDGILEKENPEDREFVVPAKLKELILNKDFGRYAMADGTMPVCFLTTNDITGGNSGSPVINGEGQLIGCAFDGNWESLSGDINFDNNLQRCIALDIRYVLFILEKLGDCGHLIKEMNIIE